METLTQTIQPDPAITEALRLLGKDKLMLAVHDASFPDLPGEDTGRGTPYSRGGIAFTRFARKLGFSGLQLGPQGQTSQINASPYDGTLFSKNPLSLDLHALAHDPQWDGLLSHESLERIIHTNPAPNGKHTAYRHAFISYTNASAEIHQLFNKNRFKGNVLALELEKELNSLLQQNRWLRDDALYEVLSSNYSGHYWREWPETGDSKYDKMLCAPSANLAHACTERRQQLESQYWYIIERYALIQLILLKQHHTFRHEAGKIGIKLFGDVQIGFSPQDIWSRQNLLLSHYFMGAPPSRTNPEGQPWGYGVLNPDQYLTPDGAPGPALTFIAERLGKMLAEFDGLRIDHPHGLICPWVYRADDPDPLHAVQNGARLFSSPDLPDHPALAHYAIADPAQINRSRPRHADDWISTLAPEQEAKYALLLDTIMEEAGKHGRQKDDILCEVLSTQPYPLGRVLQRHGLGRFRVTQKASLTDPHDVYRSENAHKQDWIMAGNHDTPPIWQLARKWQATGEAKAQSEYLAHKLAPHAPEKLANSLASDYRKLAHAKMSDLFLSPACKVMIFFADLLGFEESYNVPGTVNDENWTLRVPTDYKLQYEQDRRRGEALNLPCVLATALRAKPELVQTQNELINRLDELAGWNVN